jgi:ABC-type sugar transport system permease subunit
MLKTEASMPSMRSLLPRLVVLAIVDAIAIQLFSITYNNVSPILGIGIAVFTILANIVYLDDRFYPWRWIFPALAGMVLLVIYPIGYSLVTAFTNYGDGHNLSKEQALAQITNEFYAAPDAPKFNVYFFGKSGMDPTTRTLADFRFLFVDVDGKEYFIANGDTELKAIAKDDPSIKSRNDAGVPAAIGDYEFVTPAGLEQRLKLKDDLKLPNQIQLTTLRLLQQRYEAQAQSPKYIYDATANTLTDKEKNVVYVENRGQFVPRDGEGNPIVPGFATFIGIDNLTRVVTDDSVRGPFWTVFVWTVMFAFTSVLTTFAVGLLFATILNGKDLPLKPLWRSLLIIPYAIPFWLSVSVWKGLMNPTYGPFNIAIKSLLGVSPEWWNDPTLAKIAILFINLYLGFPYMMLICLGALQSIPADMYEAALIDGANEREKFQFITLPMLLIAVGPLLVASFAFNFNNFTVIELANAGGPPISAATAAGHTDILLSYTYRLAFAGGRGSDYGFASAIGIFIFLIVGTITFLNFRFNKTLEKVSEGV